MAPSLLSGTGHVCVAVQPTDVTLSSLGNMSHHSSHVTAMRDTGPHRQAAGRGPWAGQEMAPHQPSCSHHTAALAAPSREVLRSVPCPPPVPWQALGLTLGYPHREHPVPRSLPYLPSSCSLEQQQARGGLGPVVQQSMAPGHMRAPVPGTQVYWASCSPALG